MLSVVVAEFKSVSRRIDEVVYLLLGAIALGIIGSFVGKMAIFLVSLAVAQVSTYLFIIRDWDRGILEGLIYYLGYSGVYISKFTVSATITLLAVILASLFMGPATIFSGIITAVLATSTASLASLFSVYGGLPPPATAAITTVFVLPPLIKLVEVGEAAFSLAVILFTFVLGIMASRLLDNT